MTRNEEKVGSSGAKNVEEVEHVDQMTLGEVCILALKKMGVSTKEVN